MGNSLEAWLELIFRRRQAFACGVTAVLVLAIVGSFVCPPFFISTAEILVQQDRAQLLVSPTMQAAQDTVANAPPEEQDLNSEVELLHSPYLIAGALSDFKPAETGFWSDVVDVVSNAWNLPTYFYSIIHGTSLPTPQQRWQKKIARHLTCELLKRSSIISLRFSSHNANWSQEFLSRLVDHYLEFRAIMSHDPQAEHFFYHQADLLKARLSRSEDNLRALKLQSGVVDLEDQEKALIDQLSAFRAQYQNGESQLAGVDQRIDYLSKQLSKYPQRVDNETKVVQNIALQTLKPQVLQLEAERAELISRYRPDSERIKSIDSKLEAAKSILHREDTKEVQEVSSTINPIWQNLSSELAEAKVSSTAIGASQNDIAKQIADYEHQLNELTNAAVEIERLQRQVDTDKDAYLTYVRKGEEARAADALNLNKILNVSIAEPPTLPVEPIFPRMPINLLVGVILGCAAGLGMAVWSELRDERVFSSATIDKITGLPTVAVLKTTGLD